MQSFHFHMSGNCAILAVAAPSDDGPIHIKTATSGDFGLLKFYSSKHVASGIPPWMRHPQCERATKSSFLSNPMVARSNVILSAGNQPTNSHYLSTALPTKVFPKPMVHVSLTMILDSKN